MLEKEREGGDLRAGCGLGAAVGAAAIDVPATDEALGRSARERVGAAPGDPPPDEGRELREGLARTRRPYVRRSAPPGLALQLARMWRDRALRAESMLMELRAVLEHQAALRRDPPDRPRDPA